MAGGRDAGVVEHTGDDRQRIGANGLNLHAAKTEGTIAFNGDDRFTCGHSSADGIPHTDAHHAPRSRVESLPRFVHIDDVASKIERVCPFVNDVDILIFRKCVPDCPKCARKVHRVGRSEEHTSELQSHLNLVCRLLLEKKKRNTAPTSLSLHPPPRPTFPHPPTHRLPTP